MAALQPAEPVTPPPVAPSAVAWINRRRAMVATMSRDGRVTTCEISRGWLSDRAYVAQVVRVIGDRRRVVILGPSSVRLTLEREYVSMYQQPHRLVDVELAGAVELQDLVDRLRMLVT
jgi:hypothetical protein